MNVTNTLISQQVEIIHENMFLLFFFCDTLVCITMKKPDYNNEVLCNVLGAPHP